MGENGNGIFKTIRMYSSYIIEGLILLFVATAIAIIITAIAEIFEEDTFPAKILKKIAEAFMFIGAVGLIGTVYIILNKWRERGRVYHDGSVNELILDGIKYEKKYYYAIKE